MKVITFQTKSALEYLIKNGYLICENKYVDIEKVGPTYNWLINNMNKKVENKTRAKYPIWCWVKCNDSICPPKHKGKRVEGFDVKITFNVKGSEIFITDFRRYSFLLSNLYIPDNNNDKDKFEKLLKDYKITKEELKAYVRKDKFNECRNDKEFLEVCNIIEKSFDKCITTDSNILQGCVWKIDYNQIENIEILSKDDGYVYGSLNYKRKNGKRRDWISEYYKMLK